MNAIVRTLAPNRSRGIVALMGFALVAVALTLAIAHEVNRSFKTRIASNGAHLDDQQANAKSNDDSASLRQARSQS